MAACEERKPAPSTPQQAPAPEAATVPAAANGQATPTKSAAASSPATEVGPGDPAATYTVRGVVAEMPDQVKPGADFRIKHEAIDTFANAEGKVVGMGAMVMPFPLGPGVRLDGLALGDIVEVTFSVWWTPSIKWHVTSMKKLPAETELVFRAAQPPQPEPNKPPADGPEPVTPPK